MTEFLLAVAGLIIAALIIGGAFYLAATPRKLGRKKRLASPSGRPNDIDSQGPVNML